MRTVHYYITIPGEFLKPPKILAVIAAMPMGSGSDTQLVVLQPPSVASELSLTPLFNRNQTPQWLQTAPPARRITPATYTALYKNAVFQTYNVSDLPKTYAPLNNGHCALVEQAWSAYMLVNQLGRQNSLQFHFLARGLYHRYMNHRPFDPEGVLRQAPYEFTDAKTGVIKPAWLPLLGATIKKVVRRKRIAYTTVIPFTLPS